MPMKSKRAVMNFLQKAIFLFNNFNLIKSDYLSPERKCLKDFWFLKDSSVKGFFKKIYYAGSNS